MKVIFQLKSSRSTCRVTISIMSILATTIAELNAKVNLIHCLTFNKKVIVKVTSKSHVSEELIKDLKRKNSRSRSQVKEIVIKVNMNIKLISIMSTLTTAIENLHLHVNAKVILRVRHCMTLNTKVRVKVKSVGHVSEELIKD